jgi:DNA-binding response OmpR family regulator
MATQVQMAGRRQLVPTDNSLTVLVMTMNESDRASLAFALESAPCKLRFAKDGFEVRSLMASKNIPVVIMDGDSPTPSWRELIEQSLSSGSVGQPRFIIISRQADDRMWAEVLNLGGHDLLRKPLDLGEVAWTVQTALAEQSTQRDWLRRSDIAGKCLWSEC